MFNLGEISMKKSLVALAVLATAGTAFAQSTVTLSGSYAFGFASDKNSTFAGNVETAVKGSGFGTDTAAIKLAAVEDLGGGLKLAASVSAGGLARSAVGGEDAQMAISGGFGRVTMGTVESGNGIRPRASAGAPVFNLEGEVYSGASNIDFIGYTSSSFSGLTFGVTYVDRGAAGVGIGAGTTGGVLIAPINGQPSITANVTYANGPIDARIDTTIWTRKDSVEVSTNNLKSRVRASGTYDLGVVKLGAGFSTLSRTQNAKGTTELGLGVSAPLGPVTVGAHFANQTTKDTQKRNGFTVGASYALSKRTSISGNIAQWTWKNNAGNKTNSGNHFELLVGHNF